MNLPEDNLIFYFSGKYYYIQNTAYSWEINKQEIKNGIKGSQFEHVDAALFAKWKETKGIYLFSDQFFEYAVFSNNKLTVVERGNLSEWEYPNSFEKIDAACHLNGSMYMLTRESKYMIANAQDGIILQTGYLGEYFKWNINVENTDMWFNYDTLLLNVKGTDSTQFILKKFCDDSLQKVLNDYVIQKVETILETDENVVDQTLYEYDTYMATYIRDAKSVIYNEVNAYIEEEV